MPEYQFDLFLSHANEDIWFVRQLASWLRNCGFSVWLAEEQLVPGSRFRAGLEQGIRECRDLVAVLTMTYCTRPWTQREVDLFDLGADLSERRLLGIQIGNPPTNVMDQVFNVSQRVQWHSHELDPAGLWLLICGLKRQRPGPQETWANNGRLLLRQDTKQANAPTPTTMTRSKQLFKRVDDKIAKLLSDTCYHGSSAVWERSFAELREQVHKRKSETFHRLLTDLWASGRASEAAILFAAGAADSDEHYAAWSLMDAGCSTIAHLILISQLLDSRSGSEVWFSLGIVEMAWSLLPKLAANAPHGPIRDHVIKIADIACTAEIPFRDAEMAYDYGAMITPWNHFHLSWLAIRLRDLGSSKAHMRMLCETALQGDLRTGRFLTRVCNWPIFKIILEDKDSLEGINRARLSLGLKEVSASSLSSNRVREIWNLSARS